MSKTFYKASGGRLVEADSDSPEEFIRAVRLALGRPPGAGPGPVPDATSYSQDAASVDARATAVMRDAEEVQRDPHPNRYLPCPLSADCCCSLSFPSCWRGPAVPRAR